MTLEKFITCLLTLKNQIHCGRVAESMILRTLFSFPDLSGRLHLTISSRVKMPEQQQTLQTDFTMRGFPKNTEYDAMIAWFNAARARMREKFSSIFTEDIQTQVWERK